MRVANFQVYKLLTVEFRFDSGCRIFNRGTEPNTDEAKNSTVSFTHTEYVILEVCASGAYNQSASAKKGGHCCGLTPHSLLLRIRRVLYCQGWPAQLRILIDIDVGRYL